MIALLRFHVYGTFYSHLFDKVTQQMVTHQSISQKCHKNWIRHSCLWHLAPLVASNAVTFIMNPMFIRNRHQMKVFISNQMTQAYSMMILKHECV